MPKSTLDRLLDVGPVEGKHQDVIERAVHTQIELDEADEYTIAKNRQ